MRKILFSILLFGAACTTNHLKAQAIPSSLEIATFQRPAIFFETDGNVSDIEDAVIGFFKTKGYKKEKVKGGLIKFSNVKIEKVPLTMDYFFKISKKNRSETSIWLTTSTGPDVFTDTSNAEKWKYENDFAAYLKTTVFPYYSFDNRSAEKQKDLKNSKEDLSDLEKKKQKLEKEIEEKKAEIEKRQKELAELNAQRDAYQRAL